MIKRINVWLALGFGCMALAWLLPNHRLPWTTFHSDAWMAISLWALSAVFLFKDRCVQPWTSLGAGVALLCAVPLIQLAFGQILLAGTAWISALYLLGFLLALLAGARSELVKSRELLSYFFLAVGVAAFVSVALQFCQWLSVDDGCFCSGSWIVDHPDSQRPSANLVQPNQLATLLLWGLLALGWAWLSGVIRGSFAVAGAGLLVVGLALTESRIGALSLGVMALLAWHWRRLWPTQRAFWWVFALSAWYLLAAKGLAAISRAIQLDPAVSVFERTHLGQRLDIWSMFADAVWQQPWVGYGWSQTLVAQVLPATELPASLRDQGVLYAQAHNLFLDFVLWMGLPLGILVSLAVVAWVLRAIYRVSEARDAVTVMAVVVVGLHAMVELPLHHAYFLLPLGLVMGVLETRLARKGAWLFPSCLAPVLWLCAGVLLAITVVDYLRAEESYSELRLESARVLSRVERKPPEVILLTQIRDVIILARMQPSLPVLPDQLDFIQSAALTYPTWTNLQKLALAFSLAGQRQNALIWLKRACELATPGSCVYQRAAWARTQTLLPPEQQLEWPDVKLPPS